MFLHNIINAHIIQTSLEDGKQVIPFIHRKIGLGGLEVGSKWAYLLLTYLLTYGYRIYRPVGRPVDSRSLQPISVNVLRTDFEHFAVPVLVDSVLDHIQSWC